MMMKMMMMMMMMMMIMMKMNDDEEEDEDGEKKERNAAKVRAAAKPIPGEKVSMTPQTLWTLHTGIHNNWNTNTRRQIHKYTQINAQIHAGKYTNTHR